MKQLRESGAQYTFTGTQETPLDLVAGRGTCEDTPEALIGIQSASCCGGIFDHGQLVVES